MDRLNGAMPIALVACGLALSIAAAAMLRAEVMARRVKQAVELRQEER